MQQHPVYRLIEELYMKRDYQATKLKHMNSIMEKKILIWARRSVVVQAQCHKLDGNGLKNRWGEFVLFT
jgi:hypothetical protein